MESKNETKEDKLLTQSFIVVVSTFTTSCTQRHLSFSKNMGHMPLSVCVCVCVCGRKVNRVSSRLRFTSYAPNLSAGNKRESVATILA